jgi:hypothetical protein
MGQQVIHLSGQSGRCVSCWLELLNDHTVLLMFYSKESQTRQRNKQLLSIPTIIFVVVLMPDPETDQNM